MALVLCLSGHGQFSSWKLTLGQWKEVRRMKEILLALCLLLGELYSSHALQAICCWISLHISNKRTNRSPD